MNETRLSRKLQEIQVNIDAAESVVIDIIAGVTPWLAPLIPAYMAYQNMKGVLMFDPWLALAGALVIEFLGLATVHTAVQFASYNDTAGKRELKQQGKAPFWWSVLMSLFYLTIILSVNAILDYGTHTNAHIFTRALLSLISVPAAVTIAIRSQHKRRLAEVNQPKQNRNQTENKRQTVSTINETRPETHTGVSAKTKADIVESLLMENPKASNASIGRVAGTTGQYVGQIRKELNGTIKEAS